MDRRALAVMVTVVAALACAFPGLFAIFVGALLGLLGSWPGAPRDILGNQDPGAILSLGLVILGIGVVFMLIAVVTIWGAWRRVSDFRE